MNNRDRAFEDTQGFLVEDGPFLTGGVASPVGLDLPISTIYFQISTSSGTIMWKKFDTGINDWRKYAATDIEFTDGGGSYKPASITVKKALEEIRNTEILLLQDETSSLNGTLNLVKDDFTFININGLATGFTVKLPNATTLVEGRQFIVFNNTSQSMMLKYFDSNALITLNAGDRIVVILEDKSTTAGTWLLSVTSTTATGIISEVVTSNTAFVTSSTTDVLITGFNVTPVSGRYLVLVSCEIKIQQNNRVSEIVVDVAGTPIENTRRKTQGVSSNFESGVESIGEVTVNGSEVVAVKVNISAGDVTVDSRSLILIRLGT